MIYVYMNDSLVPILKETLKDVLSDYTLSIQTELSPETFYDIYFFSIETMEDIHIIEKIDQTYQPLMYAIGLRDYDVISKAVSKNVNMYFDKDNMIQDILSKQEDLKKQVDIKFKSYVIDSKQMKIRLRVSQIIYVESMNHDIIIHSTTGEIKERKSLSKFLKEINATQFIQTHKSYVINTAFISQIKNKEIILKNNICIPIGKKYNQLFISL